MTDAQVREIEEIVGYRFSDKTLLVRALTNESYVNENGGQANERLEFLGDGILNFIVAEYLYFHEDSDEGILTKQRAQVVSREPLSMAVDDMGLLAYYRLGKGARNGLENTREKFKSNIFEAVLAAVYLDGGWEAARAFVQSRLLGKHYKTGGNYKSELQERLAASVQYDTRPSDGMFISDITVNGRTFTGKGRKKVVAEQEAAKRALEFLRAQSPSIV